MWTRITEGPLKIRGGWQELKKDIKIYLKKKLIVYHEKGWTMPRVFVLIHMFDSA